MEAWIYLVIIYGILMSLHSIVKKMALTKSTITEVLWAYSLVSFLLVAFEFNSAIQLDIKQIASISLKAISMFISWTLSAYCIKKMPISLHGILNLSRIIFLTIFGIIFLNESISTIQIWGMIIVILGLLLVNLKDEKTEIENKQINKIKTKYIFIMIASCIFASISGLLDKILMNNMTSGQLQFWTMLYIVIFYTIYCFAKHDKISIKSISKNYWIVLLALCLIIGDRALFAACSMPESKVSIMSVLKQAGVIVTVLVGGKIFKEKNLLYRFFCALIALSGIALVVMT